MNKLVIKRFIVFVMVIAFCATFIFPSISTAGWLDSWFDQYTSSAPNYFEGQKRGYFTAGSFSARVPSSTDYLFSIEAPRLKGGCGGIDAFLGGFSFVNFDYLVQKFQRLIQAAPAVAFQIALNTLSAQLSNEIGSITKIVDALNNIQINECGMLKPFTTIDLSKGDVEKQFVDAAEAALRTTGITDLWYSLKPSGSKVETKSGEAPSASEQIKGCASSLKRAIENSGQGRGIVGYFAESAGYSSLAPIVRGMIGDLVVVMADSSINYMPTPPCAENAFEAIKVGKFFKRESPNGHCSHDNVQALRDKVSQHLMTMFNKIKVKAGGLTTEQEQIVKFSPLPVYKFLKYSAMTGDVTLLSSMADPISKGLLYQAFLDIYLNLYRLLGKIEAETLNTNNPANPEDLCNVEPLRARVKDLFDKAGQVYKYFETQYSASLSENVNAVQIAAKYSQFEDLVYQRLSERLSASLARRATSR